VALTFDDGPGQATAPILELLAAHGVRATFFMDGRQAEDDPDLARAVAGAGHEVGSHAMHHFDHNEVAPEEAVQDMVRGAAAMAGVLGAEPRLYRAPYGSFVPATVSEAEERGWTCVHWSIDGRDWEDDATAESAAGRIGPGLVPGAIVLLHDARREKPFDPEVVTGATALLLEELGRRQLRARTVSEILS
jgi:peptidoglycan/xylan/chitin deacetylase (PgdA/CDA1 family)